MAPTPELTTDRPHLRSTEHERLAGWHGNLAAWRHWGPYVAERSWGTVREDYSPDGEAWDFLPHDRARSTAYRWGEDGMAGQAEMVGTGEFVDPADDGYFVADLAPGDYFAACFVPVGATSDAGPPDPDAPHHFDEGMVSEFTVTGAAADPATDPAAETATG